MGTIISINIGNFDFISSKNTFSDLLMPFSNKDLALEECEDNEGSKYTRRSFKSTVGKFIQILDSLGYSLDAAQRDFERNKTEELEYIQFSMDEGVSMNPTYEELEKSFTFESWSQAIRKYSRILSDDTFDNHGCKYIQLEQERSKTLSLSEKIVLDTLPYSERFWGLDCELVNKWNIFRVLLSSFPNEEIITLDYTYLFEAGWCGEYPTEEEYGTYKTIILTEGKFDAEVLSESIEALYPHMSKFYSFINFDDYKVQGSTNFLTHYLKAFIASGIQNRVIALYDNDSAGLAELENLNGIRVPENFRIMHLPDIAIADAYPTLGPNGMERLNINGKACSIELYLGRDCLEEQEGFIPVQWRGFIEKVQAYQGEVLKKQSIQEKFRDKIQRVKDGESFEPDVWKELNVLLISLFNAFV